MSGSKNKASTTPKKVGGPLVTAKNLSKSYGTFSVLNDVSFEVNPGVTGLLGANGAGKTTLLGMMLGLHQVDSGALEVLGHEPWTAGSKIRERIGYAPEHHTLPPDLRAFEFVRHVALLHGLPKAEATTRASDALWLVDLGEERFRAMGTMSTGQRQRVKLAQAIAHDPKMIFLDEPTDGLDPVQRDAMLDLIKGISAEYEISVLLSSHLIDEVERVCDGAIMVGEGRTLAAGSLEELRGSALAGVQVELDCDPSQAEKIAAQLSKDGIATKVDVRKLSIEGEGNKLLDAVRDVCVEENVGHHKNGQDKFKS